MPTSTEAAVLHAFGEPQRVETVQLRDPGAGEVLVRMVAAGVCHSDVGQADGEWGHPLPAVLGHEGAGVVEKLGPGVEGLSVGQRVLLTFCFGCGRCEQCVMGRPILCQVAIAWMGSGALATGPTPIQGSAGPIASYSMLACFARHVVVDQRSLIPLPDGVPAEVAALIGCAVTTGVGAAIETLKVPAGSRGAVIGIGGVGINAVQGALLRGAAEVVAVDMSAARLKRAKAFGATGTVAADDEEKLSQLRGQATTSGFDWVIVTVGRESAMRLGVEIVKPGGAVAVVGLMPEASPVPIDLLDVVVNEKKILGSAYGSLTPRVLIPRIVRLYLEGRLKLDELVSERLPLEDINRAFDLSRRAEGLRPIVTLADGGSFTS